MALYLSRGRSFQLFPTPPTPNPKQTEEEGATPSPKLAFFGPSLLLDSLL